MEAYIEGGGCGGGELMCFYRRRSQPTPADGSQPWLLWGWRLTVGRCLACTHSTRVIAFTTNRLRLV